MTPATVLFTWELGGGYGHVAGIASVAAALRKHGVRVAYAVRDLSKRNALEAPSDDLVLQAPIQLHRPATHEPNPATFAHLLSNVGWGSNDQLDALSQGWRDVYRLVQPAAIVFEHSPTAMLAARSLDIPTFSIGTGFVQPPHVSPLPMMAPWRQPPADSLEAFESHLVARANSVLDHLPGQPLHTLSDLFADLTANFLNTFPELDHYPSRQGGTYTGPIETALPASSTDAPFDWPPGNGPRIFAYLKPMSSLPTLVRWLSGNGYPTILVGDKVDLAELQPLAGPAVTLLDRPVPLAQIRQECDAAILNANHGSTAEFLLAGKPLLQLPLNLEQVILANRTVELGVGLSASPHMGAQVVSQLAALLQEDTFRHNARQFADRHRPASPEPVAERIATEIASKIA